MNTQKNKILICGGSGYIGGYLTDLLIAKGYDVMVYDNLTFETRFLKDVPFIYGDIRDKEKLSRLLPDYDVVIWLAALVGDGACSINHVLTTEINVNSVKWLVENYSGKIIFMSTCSVYGLSNQLSDENSPTNPLSHYAATKLEAEREIVGEVEDYLAFRLGTLFGLGDYYSRPRFDLVTNILVKMAALREPLRVFGGGQWRPLLHVKDVAEAVLLGLEKDIKGLYNLSMGNYEIRDIAEEIGKIFPHVKVEYVSKKFEDLRNYRVSAEKFMAYEWKPKYDLAYGVKEIYKLLEDGRIKEPNNAVYSNADYLKNRII